MSILKKEKKRKREDNDVTGNNLIFIWHKPFQRRGIMKQEAISVLFDV
jgi:hypothetical protein